MRKLNANDRKGDSDRRAHTVLVADDEPDVIRVLTDSLGSKGYQVVTARDGREALERVAAAAPDLVILDVDMPQMDGLEVLDALKQADGGHAPIVVMLSAKAERQDMELAWNYGADLYLTKPFLPHELMDFIDCILSETGSPSRPSPGRGSMC